MEDNIDYFGEDVEWVGEVKSVEDCQQLCEESWDCIYFTYAKENYVGKWEQTCFLKESNGGRRSFEGFVSGGLPGVSCESVRYRANQKEDEDTEKEVEGKLKGIG